MRALAAIPRPARIALLVAVVSVAAVGAWLVVQARDDGDTTAAGLQPFYLEATFATDPGPEVSDEDEPREGVIRWWFHEGDRWRYEIEFTGPPGTESRTELWVGDGQLFFYEGESNSYRVSPFTPPPGGHPYPISAAFFLGPFPDVATVDELVEKLRSFGQGEGTVEVRGSAVVAGRAVTVIATAPAWSSVSESISPGGTAVTEEKSGGETLLMVDPETMFVLATSSEGGDVESFTVETRVIRYNARIDSADLRFELPADAQRVE